MAVDNVRGAPRGRQNGARLETREGVEKFEVGKRARCVIRRIASPEGTSTRTRNSIFDSQTPDMGEKSVQSPSRGKESMAKGRTRTKLTRIWCSCSASHRTNSAIHCRLR